MAIVQSCDVFFYQLGMKLSVNEFANAGRLFGLGGKTGIDLPSEATGVLPDQAYLDRRFGTRGWSRGLLLNYSIGQGEILVTPVQLCELAARFGNGGKQVNPHIVKMIVTPDGKVAYKAKNDETPIAGIQQAPLAFIREAMKGVVESDWGTGKAAAIPGIAVAGKTGTAQNSRGNDHAIFVAYAPADDPAICIAIVMENAGHGGSMAAPIAKRVMTAFFNPLGGTGAVALRQAGGGR
jgi:penicillin-binding protein 2